jgi:hypothetical protein
MENDGSHQLEVPIRHLKPDLDFLSATLLVVLHASLIAFMIIHYFFLRPASKKPKPRPINRDCRG